jgi:tRNA (guanine-N(7)-)-methyltransferase
MLHRVIDFTRYPLPRSRQHVSPNQYLPRHQVRIELSYYPPLYDAVNWHEYYVRAEQPRYVDIGCGFGKFTVETALNTPELNVLGLEVRKYAVDWTNEVIAGEQIDNAACLWYSVANGLPFLTSSSVEKIFYFFPDPWFKRRHLNRRAFTLAFLDECARVLKPDGMMYLMTDVPLVDEYQRQLLTAHGRFAWSVCTSDEEWELPAKTHQEEFSLRKHIPYVRLRCWLR